jgi:hypothetical protein
MMKIEVGSIVEFLKERPESTLGIGRSNKELSEIHNIKFGVGYKVYKVDEFIFIENSECERCPKDQGCGAFFHDRFKLHEVKCNSGKCNNEHRAHLGKRCEVIDCLCMGIKLKEMII